LGVGSTARLDGNVLLRNKQQPPLMTEGLEKRSTDRRRGRFEARARAKLRRELSPAFKVERIRGVDEILDLPGRRLVRTPHEEIHIRMHRRSRGSCITSREGSAEIHLSQARTEWLAKQVNVAEDTLSLDCIEMFKRRSVGACHDSRRRLTPSS